MPAPSQRALTAGHLLEEYEIIRDLGSGGFGVTYLAHDTNLQRDVVIKENLPLFAFRDTVTSRVHPNSATGEDADLFEWSLQNFVEEARMLARFDHPNLVKTLRVFEANGTAYFVMPYVEGRTLGDWIREKQTVGEVFTEQELSSVLTPLLDALNEIHQQKIYHRDIKPENILITSRHSAPVLIDFGAARQRLSEKSLTVVESPGYTPFEQMQSRGDVGPWSDLYGLAASLYRAITFEAPPKALDRVADDPIRVLAEDKALREHYSKGFLVAVDRALSFDHTKRPQSNQEWLEDLRSGEGQTSRKNDAMAAVPPAASKPARLGTAPLSQMRVPYPETVRLESEPAKSSKASSRANGFLISSVIAILVVIGLLIWSPWEKGQSLSSDSHATNPTSTTLTAEIPSTPPKAPTPGSQPEPPPEVPPRSPQPKLAPPQAPLETESREVVPPAPEEIFAVVSQGLTTEARAVAFSPKGDLIAVGEQSGAVTLWDVETGLLVNKLIVHTRRFEELQFAADGESIVTSSSDGVAVIRDIRSVTPQVTQIDPGGGWNRVGLSPDGRHLAIATYAGIDVYDPSSGEKLYALEQKGDIPFNVKNFVYTGTHIGNDITYSPDGTYLVSHKGSTLDLWNIEERELAKTTKIGIERGRLAFSPNGEEFAMPKLSEIERYTMPNCVVSGNPLQSDGRERQNVVTYSPNGLYLASGGIDGKVTIWDLATEGVRLTLQTPSKPIQSLVYSPDGQILATASDDFQVMLWDATTGKKIRTLGGEEYLTPRMAFCPAKSIAAVSGWSDKSIVLWDLRTGGILHRLIDHAETVEALAISADGRYLAAGGSGGLIHVWDLDDHNRRQEFRGHSERIRTLSFTPKGDFLGSSSISIANTGFMSTILWEVMTGEKIWNIGAIGNDPTAETLSCLSPDGKELAMHSGQHVTIRDTKTGQRLTDWDNLSNVSRMEFSPDGTSLASISGTENIELWDWREGENRWVTSEGSCFGGSLAFSPDGSILATGSYDTLKTWDAATGKSQSTELKGGEFVAFTADGHLVTFGYDRIVRLRDAQTLKVLAEFHYRSPESHLTFIPGKSIYMGDESLIHFRRRDRIEPYPEAVQDLLRKKWKDPDAVQRELTRLR